jgi:hypothetical protein
MMCARPSAHEPSLELFVRTAWATTLVVCLVGAGWGLQRGLSYPPTVAFAILEGALLLALPGIALGLVAGSLAVLVRRCLGARS